MLEDTLLRTIRRRRSVEDDDGHVDFEHNTYEFVDTSNYSLYHYTDDPEVNTVHIHTVSIAIVVAVWLIVTALLLSFAVVMEKSLRSSPLGVILLNLCANNFFYVVITVAWYIEYELEHSSGKGEAVCHFRWIMSATLENNFSFLLILLNVERIFSVLFPRIHAKFLSKLVLNCLTAGSWVLSLILASIQMYVTTGGIFYHAESGVCYSRGRFAEIIMRSTLHYHLPSFCLLCLTVTIIFLQVLPCKISRERDLNVTTGTERTDPVKFDPWDRFSSTVVTYVTNVIFIVLWFPEIYFYIKGNLYILTWGEIKAFIACVYLMVSGKGLITLLFTFGVKDTRNIILLKKRSTDEQVLLDMEEVQPSTVV